MLRYGVLLTLILLFYLACASGPEELPENGNGPSLQAESQVISDARNSIAIGSPDTLLAAITDLESSEAGGSEIGRELSFIASKLYSILYPLNEQPNTEVLPPPKSSMYITLFAEIEAGIFHQVPQEEASFLTLILPPLAVMFTDKPEVAALAVNALEQAVVINADSVVPYFLLGLVAEREGRDDDAFRFYDSALKAAPSCYAARFGVARMLYQLGDYEAASTALTFLKTSFPENLELLTLNTRVLFALDRLEDADKESGKALSLYRESTPLYLLRAQIQASLGNADSAARRMLNIVALEIPEDIEVLRLDAELLTREGKQVEAIAVLERAIELYPDDEKFPISLGRILSEVGQSDAGKAVIEGALDKDANNLEALEILLKDAEVNEKWAEAGEYIQRILELDDSVENLRKAVNLYLILERYFTAASFSSILASAEDAEAGDLLVHGQILIKQEKYDEARPVLERALENTDSFELESQVYYELSRVAETPDEKQQLLGQSLAKDLQNYDALVDYAAYFEEIGDLRRARRWLKQAVELRPDNVTLAEKLQELDEKVGE